MADRLTPLRREEFARLMAPLGPWPESRRVAVAVSGGADSLALATLTRDWGLPCALIVDHRLRPGSAAEAMVAAATLARLGIPARLLTIDGLAPGPALQSRARAARYAALTKACRDDGLCDLLLGHHEADQVETHLLRHGRGSAPAGLAAMAPIVERPDLRLIRPLLGVAPGRLKATLRERGIAWTEDPSNANPEFARVKLRQSLAASDGGAADMDALIREIRGHASARSEQECQTAEFLATHAEIRQEGFAILRAGSMTPAALAALIRGLSGAAYTPSPESLARLCANGAYGTLAGMRLMPAGRLGAGRLLLREFAAIAPAIPVRDGMLWDRRFQVQALGEAPQNATIGPVGTDAGRLRHLSNLPYAILSTLPALRDGRGHLAVPHVPALKEWTNPPFRLRLRVRAPVAGAPFLPVQAALRSGEGEGGAQPPAAHHVPEDSG